MPRSEPSPGVQHRAGAGNAVSPGVAARRYGLALALALAGGAVCAWLRTPLPWLIGPLLACGAATTVGLSLHSFKASRNAGQWVIGTALGLYFTPEVVARLAVLWWPILLGVCWAVVVGLAGARFLRRYAGLDRPTAFFAAAVGGASEMALQGERHGGRVESIAASHTLRVLLVVVTIPFAYRWLGLHGDEPFAAGAALFDPGGMALLVAATVGGGLAMRAVRAPNPWVLGSLLVTVAITASGHYWSVLPVAVINAGQALIGVALGTRFAPGFFGRAPRLLAAVAAMTVASIAASALFATALGVLAGVPVATMILATSPGGIAEMSLTARMLELGVPVVTAFQVTRLVAQVLIAGRVYRWSSAVAERRAAR
ncbi:MAG: AbrB family transcriptional regulator [Burkholderiaceae bacterium]|nr:AbrB family transcriptional regulator [Burkholderiaceae bacterium]